jgi:hypothetical protein
MNQQSHDYFGVAVRLDKKTEKLLKKVRKSSLTGPQIKSDGSANQV